MDLRGRFATFTGAQVLSSLLSKGEHLVVYPHWSEATHDLIRPCYKCLGIMAKKQKKKKSNGVRVKNCAATTLPTTPSAPIQQRRKLWHPLKARRSFPLSTTFARGKVIHESFKILPHLADSKVFFKIKFAVKKGCGTSDAA